MDNLKVFRIIIQAAGVYCVLHSVFTLFAAIARYIQWRIIFTSAPRDSIWTMVMEQTVYAGLLLIPAWFLLTKTDWCANLFAGMSKPANANESSQDAGEIGESHG